MFKQLKSKKAWKVAFQVLTWVLVLVFIAHPELRLLVPILDSMGLEILVGIAGLQFLDLYRERVSPYVALFVQKCVYPTIDHLVDAFNLPAFRRTSHFLWGILLTASGPVGAVTALKLHTLHKTAQSIGGV